MKPSIKIAVVGDIHDQWQEVDNRALVSLGVDLALFVGDFGNESVPIVRLVAAAPVPKAVILGNHDAWYTASSWGQKKCPYDRTKEDRVEDQLKLLGEAHVGYGKLDFPHLGLSVVGSRPFTWGGAEWKNREFYQQRYQVGNFQESAEKILQQVRDTAHDTLIFLGHNGPWGLGSAASDICGKDWQPPGGDHGDKDFHDAIQGARRLGKGIPLVAFGHMHHRLRHTQSRFRTGMVRTNDTLYLNGAIVPRIREEGGRKWHYFCLVALESGEVSGVTSLWVRDDLEVTKKAQLVSGDGDEQLCLIK
ncbi:MAG: hypothetical protein N5P05_000183 [Chroococcopsis gigantea SAG 12.99]|jgi:uncharacterized protein (TIGR04168 family)|nr:TIGR04168 family protein [Chlorogloea purpurea SAG 13.99]MDV2998577.1 hypothetical protein [Chroococcopsis gigantea SAG 12.99]